MRNSKPTLALATIFAVCGLFLASCGGGSGSGSSATTINGISVPPEPDATQNNATLAGVDSNANGVRDDVERKIAEKVDASTFNVALGYAKTVEEIVESPTPTTREAALAKISKIICATSGATDGVKNLSMNDFVANNDERKNQLKAFNDVLVGFSPEELSSCN